MFYQGGDLRNRTEAQRGCPGAEYRSKRGNCLREADEALSWIELLELELFFKPLVIAPLKQQAGELVAISTVLLGKR